jgi:hypothetical protein
MAVNKADIVTNADDLDTQNEKGHYSCVRGISSHIALSGAASDNDIILFHEIPVDALIDSIVLNSDDLGTTGDINIGFYPGPGSGTTIASDSDAVDEDAIGTAIDVNAAAVSNSEIRFETKNISTINDKAWELAGLSSKPDYATFYIAATFSEASTAAGDVCLKTLYRF